MIGPNHRRRRWLPLLVLMWLSACGSTPAGSPDQPVRLRLDVLAAVPHDPAAFTQGLEMHDGTLYESTGLMGRSSLRAIDPATGVVKRQAQLPPPLFAEGIAVVGDRIWQLTWKNGLVTRSDRDSLAPVDHVSYTGEGWGLCHDRHHNRLVMSDGSDRLVFRDPETFGETGSIQVKLAEEPLRMLNELDCAGGAVWANIWMSDRIVRIDPGTGKVTAVATASGLLTPEESKNTRELNGIASVPGTDTFYVTGKLWPKMFLVRFSSEG